MIYYEKLNVPVAKLYSKAGLIDTFINLHNSDYDLNFLTKNCNVFESSFINAGLSNNIQFAKRFGGTGARPIEIFADPNSYNDTIFEIGSPDFLLLHKREARQLLTKFNLLIYDFANGAAGTFQKELMQFLLSLECTPKNLYFATSNYNLTSPDDLGINLDNVHVLPCISMFAIYVAASNLDLFLNKDHSRIKQRLNQRFKYHAKIYNHKPRPSRITVLSKFHEADILDDCLWTLGWDDNLINYDQKDKNEALYNWNNSPIINELSHNVSNTNFIRDRKTQLPKNDGPIDHLSDAMHIDTEWTTTVKWAVSVETCIDVESSGFINKHGYLTEKTFKYFLLGIPTLPISLPGAVTELKRMGFKTILTESDIDSVCNFCISDYCKSQCDDVFLTEVALHNFKVITDGNGLMNHIMDSLKKIVLK